jgi:hypothetical protein
MRGKFSLWAILAAAGIAMLALVVPYWHEKVAVLDKLSVSNRNWTVSSTEKQSVLYDRSAAGAGNLTDRNRGKSSSDSVMGPIGEPVRGIYVSGYAAGSPRVMGRLRKLASRTEINAMVIDVKDDYGLLTYHSSVKLVNRIGADRRPLVRQPRELLDQLHSEGIYVIARLAVFKDAWLANSIPDWALHEKSGMVWRDSKNKAWINPYRREVWNYNIAIAQEAASLGFDEIQFDYVRFPANGQRAEALIDYGSGGISKSEAIGAFLGRARERLHGKPVSADVFGLVTSSADDMGIGQSWRSVASKVDAISPMVYPSHYSDGIYGIPQPDLDPAAVIRKAMRDASARTRYLLQSGIKPAQIRPWLQSFTATWLHPHLNYGENEIRQQIRAAREAGVNQYLLWSPRCIYPLS